MRKSNWKLALPLAALLLTSCSILTADRLAVLAALAGNAVQSGVEAWLVEHPEHRGSFEAIARAIAALLANRGVASDEVVVREARKAEVIALLTNLPPVAAKGAFVGKGSDVYFSDGRLLVWDGKTGKSTVIDGAAVDPVLRAMREGMRRALIPMPPKLHPHPIRPLDTNVDKGVPIPLVPAPEAPVLVRAVRRGDLVIERRGQGTNWVVVGLTNGVGEWRVRRVR